MFSVHLGLVSTVQHLSLKLLKIEDFDFVSAVRVCLGLNIPGVYTRSEIKCAVMD